VVPFAFTVTDTTASNPVQTGFRINLVSKDGLYNNDTSIDFANASSPSCNDDQVGSLNFFGGMSNEEQTEGETYVEHGLVVLVDANKATNENVKSIKDLLVHLAGTINTDPVVYSVDKVISHHGPYSKVQYGWELDVDVPADGK
jgi:hypothetical protein